MVAPDARTYQASTPGGREKEEGDDVFQGELLELYYVFVQVTHLFKYMYTHRNTEWK